MEARPSVDPELLAAFRRAVREKIRRDIAEERRRAEALREQIVPRVARTIAEARARGLCERVRLFGSFAWGLPGDRSDLDLLVEGAHVEEVASLVMEACGRMVH